MALSVQRINGTSAKVAARLCNFATAQSFLLSEHINFLDDEVAPIIRNMKGPWVDMFGYASRRGEINLNQQLSKQRISSVRSRISEYANQVNFQFYIPLGESESGPDEDDNSGYYRAVEVYVYAFKPPPPKSNELNTVRRIVHLEFVSHTGDADNMVSPDPLGEDARQNTKGLLKVFTDVVNPNNSLGNETKTARRINPIPPDYLVNQVTFNQKVTYKRLSFGSVTDVETGIDYDWGPPLPNVTIVKKYQLTSDGVVKPLSTETKIITRKDANLTALAKPPNL